MQLKPYVHIVTILCLAISSVIGPKAFTCVSADPVLLAKISITSEGHSTILSCTTSSRTMWSDELYSSSAAFYPGPNRVVYEKQDANDNPVIMCRSITGRIYWSSTCMHNEIRPCTFLHPSLQYVIAQGSGPTVGAAEWANPKSWPDNLAARSYHVLNSLTGRQLWASSEERIGDTVVEKETRSYPRRTFMADVYETKSIAPTLFQSW